MSIKFKLYMIYLQIANIVRATKIERIVNFFNLETANEKTKCPFHIIEEKKRIKRKMCDRLAVDIKRHCTTYYSFNAKNKHC